MPNPKRTRRPDRLMHPSVTEQELRCDMAIAAFDKQARAMDEKWGIDRLPELVSQATADKYAKALAQMNDATNSGDVELTQHKASVCVKGMAVMDAEAEAAGHRPAEGLFFEFELDGFKCAILKDGYEWPTVAKKRPDLRIFTPREAVIAIKAYCEALPILEVKATFPGVEIVKSTVKRESLNDAIPF